MVYWALAFFVLAVVVGIFGFGLVTGASSGFSETLFYWLLAVALIALFGSFSERRA